MKIYFLNSMLWTHKFNTFMLLYFKAVTINLVTVLVFLYEFFYHIFVIKMFGIICMYVYNVFSTVP